jgi:hypothetical protein
MRRSQCERRGSCVGKFWALVRFAPLLGLLWGCGGEVGRDGDVAVANQAVTVSNETLPARNLTLTIPALASADPMSAAIVTSSQLTFGAGSKVRQASGSGFVSAPVLNAGTNPVHAEPDVQTGSISSRATVDLRDRVHVAGDVTAPTLTRGNNVIIDGTLNLSTTPALGTGLSWSISLAAGSYKRITLSVSEQSSLDPNRLWAGSATAPARYAAVVASSRAKLTLHSGTYFFEDFDLEPDSILRTDNANGPIVIYVHRTFVYRGTVQPIQTEPDLLFVYTGTSEVVIERPLNAGLVAMSAKATLRSTTQPHNGHVLAKEVFLDAGATLNRRAALSLIPVGGVDRQSCSDMIPRGIWGTGKAAEIAFQKALLRYCSDPGGNGDVNCVRAKANVDTFHVARELIANRLDPRVYLCVKRDRLARVEEASSNPAKASQWCNAADADGDWVPDSEDSCPSTGPFDCADEHGCPAVLGDGPSQEAVQDALNEIPVVINPYCDGTRPPPVVPAVSLYLPAKGKVHFYASKLERSHPLCPKYYHYQVKMIDLPTHTPVKTFSFVFPDERATRVGTLVNLPEPWVEIAVPAGESAATTEMMILRSLGKRGLVRVRGVDGNSRRGPWSDWQLANGNNCHTIGINCGG